MNPTKTALSLAFTTTLAAAVLAIQDTPVAVAASGTPGWSWNLSRDMMIDAAAGGGQLSSQPLNNVWSFWDSSYGQFGSASPSGSCYGGNSPVTCWEDTGSLRLFGLVGVPTSTLVSPNCPQGPISEGVPIMHPGESSDVGVSWTNPINHPIKIQILGRFTTIDPCSGGAGDGVTWSVVDTSNTTLVSGTLGLLDTDVFYAQALVNPGDTISFVVNRNDGYVYDTTELDVLIVGRY